jgi:hypothetical protein
MTWHEAKEFFESEGGYLTTVTSPEEDAFVYNTWLKLHSVK